MALRWRGRLARKSVLNDFKEAAKWSLIGIPQRCPAANKRRARQQLISGDAGCFGNHDAGGTSAAAMVAERTRTAT